MGKLKPKKVPEPVQDPLAGRGGTWDSNLHVNTPIPVLSTLPFVGSTMEETFALSSLGRKS